MNNEREMNPHKIVRYLDKSPEEFTRRDLIRFIEENNIQAVNFRHLGGDGRLKTLNFVVNSKNQLDRLLSAGERVDGSNLFSYVHSDSSDLYIIPRYRTAYVNPFSAVPTVDFLCSYYTAGGEPLKSSPENVLRRAHETLKSATGFSLQAMGELEYYIVYDKDPLYPVAGEKGYEESSPFAKQEDLRCEAMQAIAQAGGIIKYGHSEAGFVSREAQDMEQNEIEFIPRDIEDAADQIVLARWILRTLAYKRGVNITFAPMISVGHAGSGLHIHSRLMQNGENLLVDKNGLSDVARKVIAGYLDLARSLTAFGNPIPLSFARINAKKEAPATVYWGDRNRSALVRVPLGWLNAGDMAKNANPQETEESPTAGADQTVELRSPDGSANIHFLLAGMAVAARHGLEMKDALEVADKLYVNAGTSPDESRGGGFAHLP
ncbi:MAG: glutamine synthetase beta-grasp domain-containing protein, partial [Dehalococcoidia bacterium]